MYTPLQLDIIREFGRKALDLGCLVSNTGGDYEGCVLKYISHTPHGTCNLIDKDGRELDYDETCFKILGHIPHLEDVFRVADGKGWYIEAQNVTNEIVIWKGRNEESELLLNTQYNPTIPLLNQDESTLTQLLTLFKNDTQKA